MDPAVLVVVQATTRTVAGIGVGALGVTDVAAGDFGCNKAFIGAQSTAVTLVLVDALGARVTAASSRGLIILLACTRTIAGVGVGALGVTAVTTGGGGRNKAVIGAQSTAVTEVLVDALGPVVFAGSGRGLVVVKATTGTVAGIGVGALGVAAVSTCRGNGNKTVIRTRTQPVTLVLVDALGPVVTTESSGGLIVDLACT
jgi:hypothetical protein